MDKQLLERFIAKYNLGGAAESVVLESDKKGIHTQFMTDDKITVGTVRCNSIELDDGQYGIYETAQLRSLLGVLENDIKIKISKSKETPTAFNFSDGSTKVTYALTSTQNIPTAPSLKSLPTWDVVLKLDQKFLSTFTKAKAALTDVDVFTLVTDGKKSNVVIGYSENNTHRVTIAVDSEKNDSIEPISFSANYFKEILLANKEMKSGVLSISQKGLAHATFDVDDFSVDYYLVKIETK